MIAWLRVRARYGPWVPYWLRPYDQLLDARRWRWQQRGRCGRPQMPPDVRTALLAAVDRATNSQQDRREGKRVRVCAAESRPAAGADLTSSLTIRPPRKVAGPVAHAGTGDTSDGES